MKFFVALVLCLAVSSTFANRALLKSLAEIDKDPFGSTILSVIALNLKAKTPVDEVGSLLQGLLSNVLNDQQTFDTATNTQIDQDEATITNTEALVSTYDQLIDQLTNTLAVDEQDRTQAESDLEEDQDSLTTDQQRLVDLENSYQATVPVLDADIEDLATAVAAVNQALAKMQQYQNSQSSGAVSLVEITSNAQKEIMTLKNTFNNLKKPLSKRSNLFTPLVRELLDLSANMKQDKADRVVSLLGQLLDLLNGASGDVQNSRATFISNYNQNKDATNADIVRLNAEVARLQQTIENLTAQIDQAQTDLEANQEYRAAALALLDAARADLESAEAKLADQDPKYENLIAIIRRTIDYFNNNLATIDEYTRNRLEGTF